MVPFPGAGSPPSQPDRTWLSLFLLREQRWCSAPHPPLLPRLGDGMCTPKPGQPRTRPRHAPQGEGYIIFKSTLCLQWEASRFSAKLPGQQENAKPKCVLFVIPRKAKASVLAGCFSRSFRGRLLTLAQQGGSRAVPQSRGIQPYLGGRRGAGRGQRGASARTRPAQNSSSCGCSWIWGRAGIALCSRCGCTHGDCWKHCF